MSSKEDEREKELIAYPKQLSKEERLRKWRDRDRARHAANTAETAEQREERLRKRRDRDRARRAANTAEQTSEINEQRCLGLEQEMEQQQEVRLEGMRTSRRGQLAMETNEERDIILETMSTHRRERLATESAEESHGYSR